MSKPSVALPGALQFVAIVYFFNGLVHCFAWLGLGWNASTTQLIPFGILYVMLGLLLHFKQYWVRYPAFLITLIGAVAAYIVLTTTEIPMWLMRSFIVVDLIVLCVMFAIIWKGREERSVELGQ